MSSGILSLDEKKPRQLSSKGSIPIAIDDNHVCLCEGCAALARRIDGLHDKVDRLTQSTKSLIEYFTTLHDDGARDLNLKIRSYATKNKLPPVAFTPSRANV